ncbi:MAG: hypothetical protein N2646_02205, partial [Bellilinea sp.]|nr:hypothetical protein [Bellilinea sp.]
MNLFNFELLQNPFFYLPFHSSGWVGWLAMLVLLFYSGISIRRSSDFQQSFKWSNFLLALAMVPLAVLLLEIRLPNLQSSAVPNLPLEMNRTGILAFIAFPIFLSAGISGVFPTLLTGLATGFFLGLFVTHDLFSMAEWGFLGLMTGIALSQKYRTTFYRLLRHPLAAALMVWIIFLPLFLLISFFLIPGSLAERLDFALAQNWQNYLMRGLELGLAGLFFELLYLLLPGYWQRPSHLIPSPSEVSLQSRFVLFTVCLLYTS